MDNIKDKNEKLKNLKSNLKYPKQSITQVDNLLNGVQDRKVFVHLLDANETNGDITREVIDSLIDHTVSINEDFIKFIENVNVESTVTINTQNPNEADTFSPKSISIALIDIFSFKNWKNLLIMMFFVGGTISIATNADVAITVFKMANDLHITDNNTGK